MELSPEEIKTQEAAISEIKSRKDELIETFVINKRPLKLGVLSFFMAGSPGAGKTEFSRRYMKGILDKSDKKMAKNLLKKGLDIRKFDTLFVRIDVDEIREFISLYQKTNPEIGCKGNAHVIQRAANKGLDMLREYCLQQGVSFLHDGTFGNYDTMRKMIKKSLMLGRNVQIFYLYIDPISAWEFTKARECLEGRNIIKEKFIEQFFLSQENVDKIKKEFGKQIQINCVLKNSKNEVIKIEFDIDSLDNMLSKYYNSKTIKRYTLEDLQALIS